MSQRLRRTLMRAAVLPVIAAGGAALGNAATSATASSCSGSSTTAPPFPAHGTAAHENAEKPVTGDAAATARAAAVKAVGSATAGGVSTVTKADGSSVEVHLDSSLTVFQGGFGH